MRDCKKCELHKTRKNVVIGEGNPESNVMLVGECPGPDEDRAGRPFVGRAGKLLRRVLDSLGVDDEDIYITNIVKCFPFYSLNPSPQHISACSPYLATQIQQNRPELVVSLGRYSTAFMTSRKLNQVKITKESGQVIRGDSYDILPILHPSYVLRGNMGEGMYGLHFLEVLSYL